MKLTGDLGELEIKVLKRSNSETTDFWDGNWLETQIIINNQNIKLSFETNLRVDDLLKFYESLSTLQSDATAISEFKTLEEGLYLKLTQEMNGSVSCKGKATTDNGDCLDFKLQTDLATLDRFIEELTKTLKSYPLVGSLE